MKFQVGGNWGEGWGNLNLGDLLGNLLGGGISQMFRTKTVHTSGKQFDFRGDRFFRFWGRKRSLTYVPI